MLTLAIIATVGSIAWSVFVVLANGMSDSPTTGFIGLGSIVACWAGTFALWLGHILG